MRQSPAGHPSPSGRPPSQILLAHLASETLARGCLHERRGAALIRVPVHRRQQVHGCEWHSRRSEGRLVSVTFTCEGETAWAALADRSLDALAEGYRAVLGRPEVRPADLVWAQDVHARTGDGHALAFRAGDYNPFNAWNTVRGAVHRNGHLGPGFDDALRPAHGPGQDGERPLHRFGTVAPRQGLLFHGPQDRTAAVLRATRRDPVSKRIVRLVASVPEAADWGLDDFTLPDGSRFTPLGLLAAMAEEPTNRCSPGDTLTRVSPRLITDQDAITVLPGPLVAAAMLRRMGSAGTRAI